MTKSNLAAVLAALVLAALALRLLDGSSGAQQHDDTDRAAIAPESAAEAGPEAPELGRGSGRMEEPRGAPDLQSSNPSTQAAPSPEPSAPPEAPRGAYPPGYQPPPDTEFESLYANHTEEQLRQSFLDVSRVYADSVTRRLTDMARSGVYDELDAVPVVTETGETAWRTPPRDHRYIHRVQRDPTDVSKVLVTRLEPSEHSDLYDMKAESAWLMEKLHQTPGGVPSLDQKVDLTPSGG
jgi:hypothetical protein